jgi:hypothetical protein
VVRTVGGALAGVEFRDAGRKQLKGIGRQRVYEVVWETKPREIALHAGPREERDHEGV